MKYVVIGASAAGISAVQKLWELNPQAEITLISKDREIYSRCILYHYLEGTRTLEELNFAGMDFDKRRNIHWIKGTSVVGIDAESQTIQLDNGEKVEYDELCIASGAHTNYPPIPGLREGNNIVGFRDLSDVEKIERNLGNIKNIFVMGAGLVGIDVIAGLLPYKKNITLADMGPYMMPIQLDEYSAKIYQDLFSSEGVKQYYGMGAKEFVLDEDNNCYKVILQNGEEILTDLVINCAGVHANIEFLEGSGIACDRLGLLTDEYGRTNAPHVYGAGDVTGRSPVWPVAVKEGIVAAYHMCGIEKSIEDYFSLKSSMHFLDVPTLSVGKVNGYDDTYMAETQKGNGWYKKIVYKEGIVVGALLQGDLSDGGILTECIRLKRSIQEYKEAKLR